MAWNYVGEIQTIAKFQSASNLKSLLLNCHDANINHLTTLIYHILLPNIFSHTMFQNIGDVDDVDTEDEVSDDEPSEAVERLLVPTALQPQQLSQPLVPITQQSSQPSVPTTQQSQPLVPTMQQSQPSVQPQIQSTISTNEETSPLLQLTDNDLLSGNIVIMFTHLHLMIHMACTGISMPPKIKRRGRPKGHQLTTIGLPAKKQKLERTKPCSFQKLHTSFKEIGIVCVAYL